MSFRRKLSIIALIYVVEGFPMGVHDTWPIYLARHDVALGEIGLLAGLRFAWSLKLLWSPWIDRYGDWRHWMSGSLAVMSVALVCLTGADGRSIGVLLWIVFWSYCLASATQDVAIDAYSIGLTDRGEEGPVNSMKAVGYRVGMLLAAALLFLPRWIGWSGTYAVAALLSVAMAAAVFRAPRIAVAEEIRREPLLPALRSWLGRGSGASVLAFVMLFRMGDLAMGPMLGPFWVDRGFLDEEIALVSKGLGIGAYVLGAVAGGWVVLQIGIARSLWAFGALALLSNLAYAAVAAFPESGRPGVYAAALVESLCGGLVSAAFLSYLMRLCQREHAAVQYALLSAAYSLPGALVASQSGFLTEWLDYASYFAVTAGFALPAFLFLPRAARRIGMELERAG